MTMLLSYPCSGVSVRVWTCAVRATGSSLLFLEHFLFYCAHQVPPTGSPCILLKDGLPVQGLSQPRCWAGRRKRHHDCVVSCMGNFGPCKNNGETVSRLLPICSQTNFFKRGRLSAAKKRRSQDFAHTNPFFHAAPCCKGTHMDG
jgi:hypothetical protein